MPELPEVETIARELRARLRKKRIDEFRVLREDYVRFSPGCRSPSGREIANVRRHGKRLQIELLPQGEIAFHLGMSGTLTLEKAQSAARDHLHLRVSFDRFRYELRMRDPRRFGGVWLREGPQAPWPKDLRAPRDLGPDALSIRLPEFRELLSRPRQIKALLLDQSAIAGLGNIYCDEALFAARIHPANRASELDRTRVTSRDHSPVFSSTIPHPYSDFLTSSPPDFPGTGWTF